MTAATTSPIAGLEVTLDERLNQVMPLLDPETARLVECSIVRNGVRLELNVLAHGLSAIPLSAWYARRLAAAKESPVELAGMSELRQRRGALAGPPKKG